jgi:hypothetical protein
MLPLGRSPSRAALDRRQFSTDDIDLESYNSGRIESMASWPRAFHLQTFHPPPNRSPNLKWRACSVTQLTCIQIAYETIKATLPVGSVAFEP